MGTSSLQGEMAGSQALGGPGLGGGGKSDHQAESACLHFPLETTLSLDATLMIKVASHSLGSGAGAPCGPRLSLSRMIYENVDL